MYRAYHAIRGLTSPDGRATNAVYGFVMMLRKLIADHAPEYIAASFDLAGPTFRDALADDYKAKRAPMPEDLVEQVDLVHESCEALGVPIITCEGFEADDVIGALARQAREEGLDVALVTGDKDFFQLVTDGVQVYNPRDSGTWYDAAGVEAKLGVRPDQVVDMLALMGDAVDNIKGVPGIGEKGARDLIAAHGSLDALLKAADTVPQKRYRTALLAYEDSARGSRDLARIRTDVPVTFDAGALRYRGPDQPHCYTLFSSLGFRSLIQEFAPRAESADKDYRLANSRQDVEQLAATARKASTLGVAILAAAGSAAGAELVGLALSTAPGSGTYVPMGHTGLSDTPNVAPRDVFDALGPVMADPEVRKIGHDLKSLAIVCGRYGVDLGGLDVDTRVASYLLDATRPSHALDDLALERTGYRAVTAEEVLGKGAKAQTLDAVPPASVLTFAAEQADLPLGLAPGLVEQLRSERLEHLYRDLELPLVPVLARLEGCGVKIDVDALAALSTSMQTDLDRLGERIFEAAGESFNINSPRQLAAVLFERLGLQATKKTGKTRAMSTAREVLEELALTHEVPGLVLKWREIQKLKGTYVDALPLLVNPATGRVHTTFNQTIAATGRLSSSEPNLQNIPIRSALGRQIRAAFVAEPGHVLISADYSQIELRVLAHLSGDEALIEAFRQGVDIHDQTAARVFGGPEGPHGLDRHELRRRAKIINYALLYGKTAFTLARDIGVPQPAAQEFIDAYFTGYPAVRAFIDRTLDEARASGEVRTITGRRRQARDLQSRNGQVRAAAERETVNMPIQGSAADILKKAMLDAEAALSAWNRARPDPARMILTVHDELLFEVPEASGTEVSALVREAMEQAWPLTVPLTVDLGSGRNWHEAKP